MARVLVSYYKIQEVPIKTMLCFWDGFVNDLKECGNDVLVINTAYFNSYNSNEVADKKLSEMISERVKDFDPELIITFNHRVPLCVLEDMPDVPVIVWDGDEPLYLCDKPYILEHPSRYYIFTISTNWINEYIGMGIDRDRIFFSPIATSIRKEDIPQDMNVSFVGSRPYYDLRIINNMKRHKSLTAAKGIVEDFLSTHSFDYGSYLKKYYRFYNVKQNQIYPLFDFRWLTLSNMIDLGLTICGTQSRWEQGTEFMPQLMACYSPKRVWTMKENQNFFNASKVSLCPIHPQAAGEAFSWRVYDIMASNACLLVSESSQLRELTKDYVDLPMFKDPWEARELCKELLADDEKRRKIVEASQRFVEETGRWRQRFKVMETVVGLTLVDEREGSLSDLIINGGNVYEYLKARKIAAMEKKNAKGLRKFNHSVGKDMYMLLKDMAIFSFLLIMTGSLLLNPALVPSAAAAVLIGNILCVLGLTGLCAVAVLIIVKSWKAVRKLFR